MKLLDKFDKFSMSSFVTCIRDYKTLERGFEYKICGQGDLSNNLSTNKTGLGFCIQHKVYIPNHLTFKTESHYYYFTVDEMEYYFIPDSINYKSYLRQLKIDEIIN